MDNLRKDNPSDNHHGYHDHYHDHDYRGVLFTSQTHNNGYINYNYYDDYGGLFGDSCKAIFSCDVFRPTLMRFLFLPFFVHLVFLAWWYCTSALLFCRCSIGS